VPSSKLIALDQRNYRIMVKLQWGSQTAVNTLGVLSVSNNWGQNIDILGYLTSVWW